MNSESTTPNLPTLPKRLENGLLMRQATTGDRERLATFNEEIHLQEGDPAGGLAAGVRDMMAGGHPTMTAADFILIEDAQADHKIISSTCLIPQTWAYDGIPFPAGRPEFVGTVKAHRRQGLTRLIFDEIHKLSAAYGHLVQGITGIPWFYRLFDYEYALALGGGRIMPASKIPEPKEDADEPFKIRPVTLADIPALKPLAERHRQPYLITDLLSDSQWRFNLTGRNPKSIASTKTFCIVDVTDKVVGYFTTPAFLWGQQLELTELQVAEGVSLAEALPAVLQALKEEGEGYAKKKDGTFSEIRFRLSPNHPAFDLYDTRLGRDMPPYSWYIRVPDLPAFLKHIAPVLEKRLNTSVLTGYNGDLRINFYRGGLHLAFEQGQLIEVQDWQDLDSETEQPQAAFPPLVFLQLLFGYRSLAELRYAFPDCRARDEATVLLNILFPKKPSFLNGFE